MNGCLTCKKNCVKFDRSKKVIKAQLPSYESKIYNLIIFFEYLTPNTSSALSYLIDLDKSEEILEEMLKSGFSKDKSYYFTSGKLTDILLQDHSLNGDFIHSTCKRFVCNISPKDSKNKLTALLRHIRNSIAHARYSIIKGGSYFKFLFEDQTEKGNITFRMVINHSTLKKWKEILKSCEKSN